MASSFLHCMSQSTSLLSVLGLYCRLTGCMLCCSIFGILSSQCYNYYHRYPQDRPFYKMLVRTRSLCGKDLSHSNSPSILLGGSVVVSIDQPPGSPSRLTPLSRVLEATHSFLISHFFYHYVIVNWGRTIVIITEPIVWSVMACFQGSR